MPNSTPDDDRIRLTPISRPDPAARSDRRRRRTLLVGAVAVLLVAGGISAWVVSANKDHKPVKHTAVLPTSFGAYTEAKPGDTEFGPMAVNTDIRKGTVDLTYRAASGKAAKVTVDMDPPIDYEPGGSDDALSALLGTDVNSGQVSSHPAGKLGGSIKCADIAVGKGAYTQCVWQDKTAAVKFVPVLDHHTVVAEDAPTDLRAFLDALTIEPVKD